jgi:tRNA(Ile)-lysidine synthase
MMMFMASTPTIIPPRHPFVKALVDGLAHRCEVTHGQRLLLAVSGGGDSVAMLRGMALIAQRRRWQLKLVVGHVQHHLRDEAEIEAAFVAELAKQLHLPFARADVTINHVAGNCEEQARQLRYDALLAMAKEHDCSAIVTAHHGGDQLETLLMRLLRGAGLRGLGAMAWSRPLDETVRLIRPMLMTDHLTALDFLQRIDQRWYEDHTNADTTRLRALLRESVIPQLLAIRSDLPGQVVTTTDQLRSISDMLDAQCQEQLVACRLSAMRYSRKQLKSLADPMRAMVLRQMLVDAGVSADRINASQLQQLGRMLQDGHGNVRTFQFGRKVCVLLSKQYLTVQFSD